MFYTGSVTELLEEDVSDLPAEQQQAVNVLKARARLSLGGDARAYELPGPDYAALLALLSGPEDRETASSIDTASDPGLAVLAAVCFLHWGAHEQAVAVLSQHARHVEW